MTVQAAKSSSSGRGFYLILFDEASRAATPQLGRSEQEVANRDVVDSVVGHLEDELSRTKDHLHTTIEQHETSVEELRASNEELQAINEELRSASEELEMSKEELQSLNEELSTVNYELKEKVEELSHSNADLQNVMASTDIGTIFLDRTLEIKFYSPPVQDVFNIISSDIGRPFGHLTHKLDYKNLAEDAGEVLRTLQPVVREVKTTNGDKTYLVRLTPYRTLEDRIDDVVLSFVDVSELTRLTEELRVFGERYRTLFNSIDEGFCIFEMLYDEQGAPVDYRFLEVNPTFEKQTGLEAAVGKTMTELVPTSSPHRVAGYGKVASSGESIRFEEGSLGRWLDVHAVRFGGDDSRKVALTVNDITERKLMEEALREAGRRKDEFLAVLAKPVSTHSHEFRNYETHHRRESSAGSQRRYRAAGSSRRASGR